MTWIKARVKPHPLEVGHPLELGHSVQGTPQAQIKAVKMEYQKCPDCGSNHVAYFCQGAATTEETFFCKSCGAVFKVIKSPKRDGMAAIKK
jgi:DNA-directed RNA polymerase subunit M/transcription elongation factor TFIIS